MEDDFGGRVAAWSLLVDGDPFRFAHRWTNDGMSAEATLTGGHLLHLAVAGADVRRVD